MLLLSGKEAAAASTEQLKARATVLKEKKIIPTLAVLQVGKNPAAENYVSGMARRAAAVSVELRHIVLPAECTREAYTARLEALNRDAAVHGILPFLPLPEALAGAQEFIVPEKDVDGVTARSAAALYSGRGPGMAPCTAEACLRLLEYYHIPLQGKRAAVVGRSTVIGKPVAMLLLQKNATVTLCHSKTENLPAVLRENDILIAAAGCRGLVTADCIREGAVVLDVGANRDGITGKIVGDVDFDRVKDRCGAISPVPGGVGPLTSTVLMEHVISAAEGIRQHCEASGRKRVLR